MTGNQVSIIGSYMIGAFLSGVISPFATPYIIEPRYGPTFLIGCVFLVIASLLAAFEQNPQFIFFFAAAANGIQNGIASIYSANLVRCSLTGSTTDLAITVGQLVRGNRKNLWKGIVLAIIVTNFWLGGFIGFYISRRYTTYTLLFNAGLFLLVGASLVYFLVQEVGVSIRAAIFGTWEWEKALTQIQSSIVTGFSANGGDDGNNKSALTKYALLQLFDHIDADQSGEIDADELLEAMLNANVKMSSKQIKCLFRAADENGDGVISKEEWQTLVDKIMSKHDPGETTTSQLRLSRLMQRKQSSRIRE
jgi:uncharacterized membrane protein YoaK (UPF0700 family)